ncbi:MAG: HigA family addiction module antitoxin [Proteobacteria bacterium]|nr:HigA family addiction module antitoxin [Pseudomonadota bacterium]
MMTRKIAPTHPGVVLAEALEAMGLKIMPAAKLLGTSRQTLHRILRGDASISTTMALKIGALCGNGPNLWLNMQANHDLWFEARNIKGEIASIEKAAAFG